MSGGEYAVGVSPPNTGTPTSNQPKWCCTRHASPFFATIPFGRTSSMTIITT